REILLLATHVPLLCFWEFASIEWLDALGDLGIPRSLIPLLGIAGGRYWPYFMALPVVALPILGKTGAALGLYTDAPFLGILGVVVVFVLLLVAAIWFARRSPHDDARSYLSPALLIATWLYFILNYAFFKFPWPWASWTSRTPNALVYTFCAFALTWAAV